jgi:hypothetical protein
VGEARWFYRGEEEFHAIYAKLKWTPCPRCKVIGTLILHGFLRGFDELNRQRKAVRARRVFCSNRNARGGCGKTFSVWIADKVERVSLTAGCLWKFLKLIADGISKLKAIRALDCQLSDRSLYRIWNRFDLGQSKLRAALAPRCRPPELASDRPAAQVIAHLQAAFPERSSSCPITDFQQATRTFFL